MKKTLVSAITTALVVGAASTTFAAANPFSDVPADSWAYDAVTKLAQDGVINGYGDGTFRGDNTITRYEMAQIVAKAMAKSDVSAADKATIDKLAAEFADELNNLGVRVDNLEKRVDNVKFAGEARYRFTSEDHENLTENVKANAMLFRLEPTAQINDNWVAKARLDWTTDLDQSTDATHSVDRAYVEGKLGAVAVKAGKLPTFSAQGLVMDTRVSGAEFAFGDKFKTTLTAGNLQYDLNSAYDKAQGASADELNGKGTYGAVQFDYAATDKLGLSAGYQVLKDHELKADNAGVATAYNDDQLAIWSVGATYKFSDTFNMGAIYAANTKGDATNAADQKYFDDHDSAYSVQFNYKGATAANPGSFGVYAAYRYLGATATIAPTWDGVSIGQKGYEIGTTYTFDKNIVGTLIYFDGKDIDAVNNTDKDASKFFANVDFFF